jgi:hypothetical protein
MLTLRLYTRLIRLRYGLGYDDYLCIAAVAASAGFCGVLLEQQLDDMYGRHYWNVPWSIMTDYLMQGTCAVTAAYCWAAALTKLSLCALYLRLFSPIQRIHTLIWVGIVFISLSYTVLFAVWLAYSAPRPGTSWTDPVFFMNVSKTTPIISIVLGAVSIFTDFYVLAIPLAVVSGLNLSTRKKYAVTGLFATGLFACGLCVAGLVPRIQSWHATNVKGEPDPFWLSMPSYALAVAEVNLGIVCTCIPVSAPLFRDWTVNAASTVVVTPWKKYLSRYRGSSRPSNSYTKESAEGNGGRLPSIPEGNLKTLMSFIGRGSDKKKSEKSKSRSQHSITVTKAVDIEMAPYSELRSIDMEYHSYLTPAQMGGSQNTRGQSSRH